jgi:predicted transposase/invertase (TIGR01784 family)
VFYEKLNLKFLQMPLFKKREDELESHFDKWLYFLKNLESFDHIPAILNEPIFQKGFEIAELSHLTSVQYEQYQKSLIQYWDLKSVSDTSFEEGVKKVAKNLLAMNLSVDDIVKATGLTSVEIENLKNEDTQNE